ncbi:MAG: apolipoprotein N-acyltransferase [Planctomycetota bacterium]
MNAASAPPRARDRRAPWKTALLGAGLCALSVGLLLLAFAPFDQGYLAYVALVPFFWAFVRVPRRTAFHVGLFFGIAWWLASVWWIAYPTLAGYLAMCLLFLPVYSVIFVVCARWMRDRWPRGWIAAWALLWVALEALRSSLWRLSFPLFLLGHTQWRYARLLQTADLAGAYGLSFLVAYANACLFALLDKRAPKVKGKVLLAHAAAFAAALCASLAYGEYRLRTVPTRPAFSFATVQGNIPQEVKETGDLTDIVRAHVRLTAEALSGPEGDVDLVLWPETMLPVPLSFPEVSDLRDTVLRHVVGRAGTPFLIGALFATPIERDALEGADAIPGLRLYNSAYLVSPEGEILSRYDKMKPIIMSEYIPFQRTLPFLRRIVPENFGYLYPGRGQTIFDVKGVPVAVVICYEDMMSDLARHARAKGARVLVNLTNDGWFRESSELAYHFSTAVFRAVENRSAVIRSANTGVTGWIDPLGVPSTLAPHRLAVFRATVRTCDLKTPYSILGDAPLWLASAALLLALGLSLLRSRRAEP